MPLPSTSTSAPDSGKENMSSDQPNGHSNRYKGKQRALDTDATFAQDQDEDMRISQPNGTGASGEDEDENGQMDGLSSDEDDDEETRLRKRETREQAQKRQLRAKYRMLQSQVEDRRGDLANTTVDDLSHQVTRANQLFSKVQAPAEAVLDSRVLIATSEAGALKARQLKIDADAFDIDEFLVRLTKFMGGSVGGRGAVRTRKRAANDDESEDELDEEGAARSLAWGKVGKVLSGESKRPAVLEHMYGPLQLEIKEKKQRTQRAKQKIDESERMRPEELHAEDVAKNENETGKVTARIARHLQEIAGATGIPYLKFIVNPHSFPQTVENMFYFSFLVREQKVALEVDDNEDSEWYGDMIAYMVDPESAAQIVKDGSMPKHQVVLELTQEVWQAAIEAYDIQESMIPTRQAFVPPTATGKHKW
ncbi:hypothetical protein JCM5296_001924 [Sporobolomyces johnsonii]